MLQKLNFLPGIFKRGTSYTEPGRWYDCQWIRFRGNYPEKIGGWTKYASTAFLGVCRRLRYISIWSGTRYLGIGTSQKFYMESGGTFNDVTPLRATSSLGSDPLTTASGTSTVTVTDTAHGASVDDWVTISGATTFNGIDASDLNIEVQVGTVVDANTWTYTSTGTASGSGAGGGASVQAAYQLSLGSYSSPNGTGWGAGPYDSNVITRHWGEAIDLSAEQGGGRISQWSVDPYGEDLILTPRYGAIYYWDATTPTTRAVDISTLGGASNTPSKVIYAFVFPRSRHVVGLGCNPQGQTYIDPMLIRWSDNEDIANWTPSTTVTAGSQRLTRGSEIIVGIPTRELTLIFTDTSLYSMQWIGGQYVFSLDLLAENANIAGYLAGIAVDDSVYWMSKEGFYFFNGSVVKLECTVQDYVLNDVDWEEADKIVASTNSKFDEVWWNYVSKDSTDDQPDKYVVFNYIENTWYVGSLTRTFMLENQFDQYPLAAGTDNYVYYHEYGFDDGSSNPATAIESYIESLPFEIGEGDQFGFITRMIHDLTFRGLDGDVFDGQQATVTLSASDYPGQAIQSTDTGSMTRTATAPVEAYTTYTDMRLRGRQFRFKISSNTKGSSWRLGTPRLEIRTDGRK